VRDVFSPATDSQRHEHLPRVRPANMEYRDQDGLPGWATRITRTRRRPCALSRYRTWLLTMFASSVPLFDMLQRDSDL
jgi:hypothetical protein